MKIDEHRPDPDELLSRISMEEKQTGRAKLKIFLGYAAGVGKTFAMLEAAHQRIEAGVDVVVGLVETHNRIETGAMLDGLEVLERKQINYRGVILTELDVDAVLARRPELVLVDELAHTNAPGLRHPKRYQDVEEILAAGIDVFTTMNIQHLESLNDVVSQITGIRVRETVPDGVIDEATEIELIDLPPDELLVRLKDGKVYLPEQAANAIQKFFRTGNLTALRELTMRRAAERVDDQMRAYMQTKSIPGPWPAAERLLVCISPNPLGERLVRSTRRLADELNAQWMAVYVEDPKHSRLSQAQRDHVTRTLLLAEELGARSFTLMGNSVPDAVLKFARENNVTKIMIGKPLRPAWIEFLTGSVAERLIRASGNIDVYIVSGEVAPDTPVPISDWTPHQPLSRYVYAVLLVLGALGVSAVFRPLISPSNLIMVILLTVVIAAVYLGRGPSILVSILGVLAFDFFFVPPYLTFAVEDTEYVLTFIALFVVGLVISQLTARLIDQAEAAQRREAETATLYALSRDLSIAEGLDEIIQAVHTNIRQIFGREVVVYLPEKKDSGLLVPHNQIADTGGLDHELAVAAWSYQHGQSAGRGTDTLPASELRYLPLITPRGAIGVLGVKPEEPKNSLTPDQRRTLELFTSQASLAIERALLAEEAKKAQLLQATENLQVALLNSISHDLRTPLVSITGALSSLAEGGPAMDAEIRQSLIETAREEADRMNRLVGNLLNMSRIEAGALQISMKPSDIQDAIGTALENMKGRLDEHSIHVEVQKNLPLIPMDFVLIVQVLINLIDNSLKYAPPGTPIEILAALSSGSILVQVSDRGIGIPEEDLTHVFEKFYRVIRPESVSGTGLGLSINRGIIEAHGGRIWAENRAGGGTRISFTLPLQAIPAVT